ncbi:hypothetical protein M9Y10_033671 [Tritrichomonas musculus]|uniref:RecQ-mediated genome instability protein 1 n=1 Tax=Tritrichomonas musculus TaxID=1915356 RepID=A0ABR2KCS9_9EUKA
MEELFNSINAKPTIAWLNKQTENHINPRDSFNFFLDNDLQITSENIIDPDIFLNDDFIFDSNVLVQIDEIIDISLPLNKRENFNINNNEKKRTFKFLLSDGHFQFVGVSKNFLHDFDPRIVPGIKMQILKGTKVKFGVIFLEKEKIVIVGGQSLDMREKRHSIVLYDEQKYKDQQNGKNKDINQQTYNIEKQQIARSRKNPPKSKKSSLIIIKDNEVQSNVKNKGQLNILLETQDNTKKAQTSNKVNNNTVSYSFLSDNSSFDSDNFIDKIENKTQASENNKKSEQTLFDQISSSSYSSDVEIINSIIHKHNEENLVNKKDSQKTQSTKKFLSDNDDFDDFDFENIQSNAKCNIDNTKTEYNINKSMNYSNQNSFDEKNMKIFTLADILKRENTVKTNPTPTHPEIFLLDGKIVECNDLKIFQKKTKMLSNTKNNFYLFFSMNCKIACGESTMEMNVASRILDQLLESTPEKWIKLEENEQIRRYDRCSQRLLSFKSPLYILSCPIHESENDIRYFIINEEFLALIDPIIES